MRGKKRQLYDFFVEIGFFLKFTKLLISNLKNQSGRVWTTRTKVLLHVSFIGLPFTWLNGILTLSPCPYIYWLILSASLWCNVRMRRLVSTTRTSTMAIDVLKFRPTSIFCSNTSLLLLTSEYIAKLEWHLILIFPVITTKVFRNVFSDEHCRDDCRNCHCNRNKNDHNSSAGSRRTIGSCQ